MMPLPIIEIMIGIVASYFVATLVAMLVSWLGFPLPPLEKRAGSVDGLRGYLAISVLFHHFIVWIQVDRLGGAWEATSVRFFDALGTGSVSLFFMTTGFLFYTRVLAGYRACSWLAIYTSRFFRIVPLIAISVIIITAIISARTGRGIDSGFPTAALRWIAALGEPPLLGYPDSARLNAHVLWSLRYEWLFYLIVLPLCAIARDLIRGRMPSSVLPAVLFVACFAARALIPDLTWSFLLLFSIGMLTYEVARRENIARRLQTPAAAVISTVSLILGMTSFSTPYDWGLLTYGLFFMCVASGNSFGGVLKTTGSLVLGECSYSIYILHGILLSLLFVDGATLTKPIPTAQLPVTLLPFAAAVIAVITPLSFLLVERPAIRFGRSISRYWADRHLRSFAPDRPTVPEGQC